MHDPQKHVFTNEFDDLSIVISLSVGDPCAGMLVVISKPDSVWEELVPISKDNLHQMDIR